MSDLYTLGTLVRVVRSVQPPVCHFRNRYYTTFHQETTGGRIFFDRVKGKRRIAPYVHPRLPGKVVEMQGYTTHSFEPPYVKPKTPVRPDDVLKRLPGEALMVGNLTPAQRRDLAVTMIFADHEQQISVREEAQCAEFLRTGKVTVKGEGYPDALVVDFKRDATLTETLVGAGFNTAGFDAMAYLKARARRVRSVSSGSVAFEVTMDPAAMAAFEARLSPEDRRFFLDSNSRAAGNSEWNSARIPGGAQYVGMIGQFRFFEYEDTYQDHDGNDQQMMPEGQLVLASAAIEGVRCYGAIQDADADYVPLRHYPAVYREPDPSVLWALSQSAPLMAPFNPNASFGAQVFA